MAMTTAPKSHPTTLPGRILLWLLFLAAAMTLQLLWNLRLADAMARAAYLNSAHAFLSSASASASSVPPPPQERSDEDDGRQSSKWARAGRRPLSLDEVTKSSYTTCPKAEATGGTTNGTNSNSVELVYVDNNVVVVRLGAVEPSLNSPTTTTTIPPVIHQTSKSRCVTPKFAAAVDQWKAHNSSFSYYLHDDEAVQRLFESMYEEFPLLEMVTTHCVASGAIKSDLWRYVALWRYGGVYIDIDSIPGKEFDPATILAPGTDALFVVEHIGLLSQYFIAASPRHPIMWYAIQHTLHNLLEAGDIGKVHAPTATGPHALHAALRSFRADVGGFMRPFVPGSLSRPVRAATYVGTGNRTVKAIGTWEQPDAFVKREIMDRWKKQAEYDQMSMKHFSDVQRVTAGKSCLKAVFEAYYARRPVDGNNDGMSALVGEGTAALRTRA